MQLFRDVLDDYGFVDLGYTSPQFTWTNNRVGDVTWERLDRVVATPEWLTLFPSARVHHLDYRWSDHKSIWVGTKPMVIHHRKPFRFEKVWTSDHGYEETIEAAWKTIKPGVPMYIVWEKIHACRRGLHKWGSNNFGNIQKQIRETENQLKQAEAISMQGRDHAQVITLKAKLCALLVQDERLWRQRSRVEWLKARDKNTRYFLCKASQRRHKNHVYQLKDQAGMWTSHQDQVPPLFIEYYSSLFTSANPPQVEQVVECI